MSDVSPELLERLRNEFNGRVSKSGEINKFINRVRDGTATLKDANGYCAEIGEILTESFRAVFTGGSLPDGRLYWNIAEAVVKPMLEQNCHMANDAAIAVQAIEDAKAGIRLKALDADMPDERIKGILDFATEEGLNEEQLIERLSRSQTLTHAMLDDFILKNADVRTNSGYSAVVIRTGGYKCCDWCMAKEGIYRYPDEAPREIFQRHNRCTCNVVYKCGKTYQDVYSKAKSTSGSLKEMTSEQAEWLARYDAKYSEVKKAAIAMYMSKGYDKKKAYDMFNANKRKLLMK